MPIRGKANKIPLGIYIHVPFCRSKCQYCDFYSLGSSREKGLTEEYLEAVCNHMKEAAALAPGYRVNTVYFGGGTPSYLGWEGLTRILNAIRRRFDLSPDAEITFEANPDSITEKLLKRLKSEGFNRISLGVQTDDDQLLRRLGRPHNYRQVVQAYGLARSVGFANISLDLIYGLPGQSLSDWERTLEHVLELSPDHMSCYGLKVEPGTPLWEYKDAINLPDDDTQADMYLSAIRILKEKGYAQYEISNFARRGLRSRHNLKYWTGGEYLGFGPAASSDFGGKRFTVAPDIHRYIAAIGDGGTILTECQEVPARERAGEYLMLRLRTADGIEAQEYMKQYLLPFEPLEALLEKYRAQDLAALDGGRWHLTPRGFLLSNTIITELLEVQEASTPLAKRRS